MRRTLLRLLSSFRTSHAERELSREIRAHLQLLEDEFLACGMHPETARRAARRAFGGVEQVKERQRDARMFRWLAGWPMDLRLGGRMLVKYPGLTLVGGLAMAFAIWVGLIAFQVVGLFVHPSLPLTQGTRLVEIRTVDVAANDDEARVLHDVLEWQQSLRSVTDVGAWRDSNRNLIVSTRGEARPVHVAEMSASGFRLADGNPVLGRMLDETDAHPAAPAVAVISHDLWHTQFGSAPDVVGRGVQLGHEHATVVGVMQEGFEFPVSHDVWLPLRPASLERTPRAGPALTVFALLAPGETLQSAQAELTTAGRRAAAAYPDTHRHLEPRVRPYAMMRVPDDPEDMAIMYSVYVFVALLLALTCGNVGLLLFARAASREADLVVRTALGASRGRLVAQLFAEALVLGGVAALAGVAAAAVTLRTWGTVFLETNLGRLPFWFDLTLSPSTFVVALGLTVASAAIAGILPAMKMTRAIGPRLRQSSAGSGGLQFGGGWTVVIVAQVAATVIFPALVYTEQSLLRRVRDFDAGFASDQYLAVHLEQDALPEVEADDDEAALDRRVRLAATLGDLRRRLEAQPGVSGVTFAEDLPTTNHPQKLVEMGYDVEPTDPASGSAGPAGQAPSHDSHASAPAREATVAPVDPSYFDVLDAPVLAGRGFTPADAAPGARVAVVDQGFVEEVLQGRNAVGQRVRFKIPGPAPRQWAPAALDEAAGPGDWYEVVGVVPELGVGAPTQAGRAAGFYVPATPDRFDQIHMLVHVRGDNPTTAAPGVRETVTAVDPSMRILKVQRASEANDDVMWVLRLWLRLTAMLSAVALVLSLAGIYAVLSFTVARRTREIGVRVALGASRPRVVAATFRRPLSQVALGVALGTAAVFTAAVLTRGTEFPGSEHALAVRDAGMIVAYGMAMLVVCLLGCVVPTYRALAIDPTVALRTD